MTRGALAYYSWDNPNFLKNYSKKRDSRELFERRQRIDKGLPMLQYFKYEDYKRVDRRSSKTCPTPKLSIIVLINRCTTSHLDIIKSLFSYLSWIWYGLNRWTPFDRQILESLSTFVKYIFQHIFDHPNLLTNLIVDFRIYGRVIILNR